MMNNGVVPEQEFYRILDEEIPGGQQQQAVSNPKRRLYLTRISMDGLGEMNEYSTKDKRFYDFLEYEPFKDIKETENYLNRLIKLEGTTPFGRSAMTWFIKQIKDNKIVGTVRLVNIDYYRRSVSWGYGLDPELWGQGFVFEIQEILMGYIFEELRLNRLGGVARMDNLPTITTLKAIGMKEEGILRQSMRDSTGKFYDAWCYSMLAEEYFTTKQVIQKTSVKERYNEEAFTKIMGEFLEDANLVNDELMMKDLPVWDSLRHMELVFHLEDAYKIEFTLDEIVAMISVKSIKNILKNRMR